MKNAEENQEQLGKQEKYLFRLNGSFIHDNDRIQKGSITRKQGQDDTCMGQRRKEMGMVPQR